MSAMFWIAIAAVVGAVVCVFLSRRAQGRARTIAGTETTPIGDLRAMHKAAVESAGQGQFHYACEVVGSALPLKDGPLSSEIGNVPCIWHKHKVTHKYWEMQRDSNGRQRRQERSRVVAQNASDRPFRIEDASGKIPVRLGRHEIIGAEKVLDRFDRGGGDRGGRLSIGGLSIQLPSSSGTIGFKEEEWVVRPGRQMYVLGEASDADGRLVIGEPSDGGVFIVSAKSQQELLKSERGKTVWFTVAAAAAAVLGVVLFVLEFAT